MTNPAATRPSRKKVVLKIMLGVFIVLIAVTAIVPVTFSPGIRWNVVWVPSANWRITSSQVIYTARDGSTMGTSRLFQVGPVLIREIPRMKGLVTAVWFLEPNETNVIKEEPGSDPEATSGSQEVAGEGKGAAGASEGEPK